ncbi:MAG TPA: hypothetical protein PKE45_15480, partial [Caldilineaceae bacterium]|nr:hypothetical protein [Caldilineaceae bacterium]
AGLEGQVYAAVVAANGDLYIGGDFTKVGGIEAKNIARWDGRSWHPLGAGLNQRVAALAIDGDTVYVAGDFTSAGAVTVAYIAKWSGTAWSKVGNGVGPMDDSFGFPEPGRVKTLLVGDGGLYAGGNFVSMDGVAANKVVFWNGQKWSALGNGVGRKDFDGNFSGGQGDVRALLLDGDDLYVAGGFDMAGESEGINAVARWDGTNWSGLGSGFIWDNNDGTSLAKVKTTLYAGGIFNRADGQPAARLAGWDGTSWSEAGGGVAVREFSSDNGVNTLLASGDQLIVGGNFVAAGGQAIDLLASWDGAKWSEVGEGLQNPDGFDTVLALAAAPEGGIYIGGSYKFGGNLRIDNIGLWDGQLWHPLGKGLAEQAYGDSPADIYALGIDDAGRVYAGGEFEYAGGLKVENLAMWDGEAWRNIGGTNGRIRTLVVVGDDLYIGGEFTRAGGIAANHVARWNR